MLTLILHQSTAEKLSKCDYQEDDGDSDLDAEEELDREIELGGSICGNFLAHRLVGRQVAIGSWYLDK